MKTGMSDLGLAVALSLAGIGLLFVPVETARPVRVLVRDALGPGQKVLDAVCRQGRAWSTALPSVNNQAGRISALEDELQSVRLANRGLEIKAARLSEELQKLSDQQGWGQATTLRSPLVTPRLVSARVLGEESAVLWRGRKFLGAGDRAGITESALVLDDTRPLVDQGDDARLSPGDAVYAGRVVIGKIAEVGRFSSTLKLVTDSGYSGRARLARRTSQGLVFGAEGTLVGDSSDLCQLKHIADPVNVGDEVFTGGTDGSVPLPMYYGTVVRTLLEPGAQEWSIWVKPAATAERLETVLILRRVLNPDRMMAN
jgi:cell shape-determining protein MreC